MDFCLKYHILQLCSLVNFSTLIATSPVRLELTVIPLKWPHNDEVVSYQYITSALAPEILIRQHFAIAKHFFIVQVTLDLLQAHRHEDTCTHYINIMLK